jgi:endogenous inhibitor of DNA gyrase (YacG/DUF329 family)
MDEILVDDVVMMKTENGIQYARCFHCGRFFTPTIKDKQLLLFCSDECNKADSEHWEKVIDVTEG